STARPLTRTGSSTKLVFHPPPLAAGAGEGKQGPPGGTDVDERCEQADYFGDGGRGGGRRDSAGPGAAVAVVDRNRAGKDQSAAERDGLPSPHLQFAFQGRSQLEAAPGRCLGRGLSAVAETDRHVAQRDRAAFDLWCLQ